MLEITKPTKGKVYATSDLHGYLDLYRQIKSFIKPEDIVICLGDCGDRGPHSWETIKAVAADSQFIYLMGNHEHMLLGTMMEYLGDSRSREVNDDYVVAPCSVVLIQNGGLDTFTGWQQEGENPGWINYFLQMPDICTYNNGDKIITLCHAGFSPVDMPSHFDLLWGRSHFFAPWRGRENEIIVHGHTPAPILQKRLKYDKYTWDNGALWYCDHHKVDIDQGTPTTRQALLLDLDDFHVETFQSLEEEKGIDDEY